MADVKDPPVSGQEPSMEEILASIRKIITDENVPAAPAGASAPQDADDVLELTQMVPPVTSAPEVKPEPKPPSLQPPPMAAAPPPPPAPPAPPPPAPPPIIAKPAPAETLVSAPTMSAAAMSLSSLASTVQIDRLSHAPHTSTPLGNGGRTLEDMVLEFLRPLLREWLDQNLPSTVDRLVQKEIERIARKAED